jgi:hypothetical protein
MGPATFIFPQNSVRNVMNPDLSKIYFPGHYCDPSKMTVIIKNFQLGHKFDASRQLRGLKFV